MDQEAQSTARVLERVKDAGVIVPREITLASAEPMPRIRRQLPALAAQAADGVPATSRDQARLVAAAMREVADHLGNTPAVARASYVDPRLIEQFEQGRTVLPALRRLNGAAPTSADLSDDGVRAAVEAAVIRLLRT